MDLPPRLEHIAAIEPKAYVYALLDPGDREPRWIGSSLDPRHRAWQHWHDAKYGYTRSNQQLYEWLLSLAAPPGVLILEEVPKGQRWEAEARWTEDHLARKDSMIFNQRLGKSRYR